jgi:phytoene synthase
MPVRLSEAPIASEPDHRACAAAIRGGSRTFYLASWLLPSAVRRPAFALYAFCRLYDDAIDLEGGKAEALKRLRTRLDCIYEGSPQDHPADRAFADVVRDHDIPRALPEALIEGLSWDCEGRRYATLDDLQDYAARVAGTVGVMMAILMGVRDRQALSRACDLDAAHEHRARRGRGRAGGASLSAARMARGGRTRR